MESKIENLAEIEPTAQSSIIKNNSENVEVLFENMELLFSHFMQQIDMYSLVGLKKEKDIFINGAQPHMYHRYQKTGPGTADHEMGFEREKRQWFVKQNICI